MGQGGLHAQGVRLSKRNFRLPRLGKINEKDYLGRRHGQSVFSDLGRDRAAGGAAVRHPFASASESVQTGECLTKRFRKLARIVA